MREFRLRWFGYVQRQPSETMSFCHSIKRGCYRPKRTWIETIKKDIEQWELTSDMAYDKINWKERICTPHLNFMGASR